MTRMIRRSWEKFARQATQWTGRPSAFAIAVAIIVVWLATGPIFHYSDTWQLVINTGTTVVTFLMVFLIQHAQNKDTRAIELKLNELVAAMPGASNRMIDVEALSEQELDTLHRFYRRLVTMAKKDAELTQSHSVEEATVRYARKKKREQQIEAAPPAPPPPAPTA
jgi:low affinity Fe/Cu permease